jgi:hypothetical protein
MDVCTNDAQILMLDYADDLTPHRAIIGTEIAPAVCVKIDAAR